MRNSAYILTYTDDDVSDVPITTDDESGPRLFPSVYAAFGHIAECIDDLAVEARQRLDVIHEPTGAVVVSVSIGEVTAARPPLVRLGGRRLSLVPGGD